MIRNTAREIAVHLAYELSFTDKTVKELLDERLTKEYFDTLKDEDDIYEKAPGAAQTEYIRSIVSGVAEHAPELDGYIAKYAKGWSFDRIPLVASAIMRVAMYANRSTAATFRRAWPSTRPWRSLRSTKRLKQ